MEDNTHKTFWVYQSLIIGQHFAILRVSGVPRITGIARLAPSAAALPGKNASGQTELTIGQQK
jgi:hypothetical protein